MSALLSWLITLLVVILLAAFVLYLISLRRLPLAQRPRTPTFNRFGEFIEYAENPDYRENPGEDNVPEGKGPISDR